MSLLFGRNRAMMAAHEVFRDMPRLPLSLQPLTGDLAATINRATQGRDIGQADPIWVSAFWGGGGRGWVGMGAVCIVFSMEGDRRLGNHRKLCAQQVQPCTTHVHSVGFA